MLKNGILRVCLVLLFINSPVVQATDTASTIDEVVSWWEKYGKYWDDVTVADSSNKDTTDTTTVSSND